MLRTMLGRAFFCCLLLPTQVCLDETNLCWVRPTGRPYLEVKVLHMPGRGKCSPNGEGVSGDRESVDFPRFDGQFILHGLEGSL
jgi:hypothetical protein